MFAEVSGRKNFVFKPKDKQTLMINKFITEKERQIGDNWLFDFFLFQFNRYHNQKTRFGTGIVHLNWVIGKKALESWKNRTEQELFYIDDFRQKYNLKNPLIPKIQHKLSEDHFNNIRKRKNIVDCLNFSLYEEKNVICRFCENKLICKQNGI